MVEAVQKTSIPRTLHKAGLYGKTLKPIKLTERIWKANLNLVLAQSSMFRRIHAMLLTVRKTTSHLKPVGGSIIFSGCFLFFMSRNWGNWSELRVRWMEPNTWQP